MRSWKLATQINTKSKKVPPKSWKTRIRFLWTGATLQANQKQPILKLFRTMDQALALLTWSPQVKLTEELNSIQMRKKRRRKTTLCVIRSKGQLTQRISLLCWLSLQLGQRGKYLGNKRLYSLLNLVRQSNQSSAKSNLLIHRSPPTSKAKGLRLRIFPMTHRHYQGGRIFLSPTSIQLQSKVQRSLVLSLWGSQRRYRQKLLSSALKSKSLNSSSRKPINGTLRARKTKTVLWKMAMTLRGKNKGFRLKIRVSERRLRKFRPMIKTCVAAWTLVLESKDSTSN